LLKESTEMEALLLKLEEEESNNGSSKVPDFSRDDVSQALARFVQALREAIPLLEGETKIDDSDNNTDGINMKWLLSLVEKIPSELGSQQLARAVWDASQLADEGQKQEALFAALGASEEAMEVLFQIAPHLPEVRQNISPSDFDDDGNHDFFRAPVEIVDEAEQLRQRLRQEALDAAQVAAIAQAEADAMAAPSGFGSATHSITRSSDVEAQKMAKKAQKRAAQAMQRARDAGAIIDEADLLAVDEAVMGSGGLMRRSQDELRALQESLQPEGTRYYHSDQGLPSGTEREENDKIGYEKVTIPPPVLDADKLHPRLRINDILDSDSAVAFDGVDSLNPMQSAVFDTAFNRRENMLVCAPTGAGKVCCIISISRRDCCYRLFAF
jgi:hypothetical protein